MSRAILRPPPAPPSPPDPPEPVQEGRATRSLIRGSSLLLAGRFISLAIALLIQVLIVRYLSKSAFGAFAYGIGVASMGSSLVLFGLDKSVARFVPIYQERGEPGKVLGTILLAVLMVGATGGSLVALCYGFQGAIGGGVVSDPLALSLLLVLIALAPIDALDALLQGQLAIFVGPRAIFVRRHLLGPGLKLAAVLLVMATAGDARLLAWGYVTAGLVGLSTYAVMLVGAWRRDGLLAFLRRDTIQVPAGEVLRYSLPLVSSDIVLIMRGSFTVVLLEYLQSTAAVAEYRAVLPFAKLNLLVLESFAFLFIPVASRMFARRERLETNALYWRTATWIAVLTFPVFAVMFALSEPFTLLLFGSAYADSAPVLSLLAVGFYAHAALGFNQHILRVHGRVRFIVTIDLATAVLGLVLHLLLIPRFGALGAAAATTATFVLHKLLAHLGLVLCDTGVRPVEWRHLSVYVLVAGLAAVLMLVQQLLEPPLMVGLLLAAAASLLLIRTTRDLMRLGDTFPELRRVPVLGRLVS